MLFLYHNSETLRYENSLWGSKRKFNPRNLQDGQLLIPTLTRTKYRTNSISSWLREPIKQNSYTLGAWFFFFPAIKGSKFWAGDMAHVQGLEFKKTPVPPPTHTRKIEKKKKIKVSFLKQCSWGLVFSCSLSCYPGQCIMAIIKSEKLWQTSLKTLWIWLNA
jgi:hypothetical protein